MKSLNLIILFLVICGSLAAQQLDLNHFLDEAKANSPLINKNRNEIKLADLDLFQIRAILTKPEINIESGIMLAPVISHNNNSNRFQLVSDEPGSYSGYDLASTDGGQYNAMVTVKQPLFTGTRYRSYSNKADILRRINENNISLTVHETEQVVTYQYILCMKSKTDLVNYSFLLKNLEGQLQIMHKLVENGIYKQTDLLLLQIEYQNYEVIYKSFQDEYKTNIFDLYLLCGINDTSLTDIQEIDLKLKSDDRSYSQFLTSFRLDSLSLLAGLEIDELKYKPEVSLFADAGLNAVYIPTLNRLGFSTGLSFQWNIFDGNQRKIQRDKYDIMLRTIEFEKTIFINQNNINKNKILSQINSLDQRLKIIGNQIDEYNRLSEVYMKELSQGEISVMDFKNLLKDITAKKQECLLMKIDKLVLINSYNYWNY